MVTKSCEQNSCRDPWTTLFSESSLPQVNSLSEAMDAKYDDFFSSFPLVQFKECGDVRNVSTLEVGMGAIQIAFNEEPFYPPDAPINGLGKRYRKDVNYAATPLAIGSCNFTSIESAGHFGTWAQRNTTLEEINKTARELTNAELPNKSTCAKMKEHLA